MLPSFMAIVLAAAGTTGSFRSDRKWQHAFDPLWKATLSRNVSKRPSILNGNKASVGDLHSRIQSDSRSSPADIAMFRAVNSTFLASLKGARPKRMAVSCVSSLCEITMIYETANQQQTDQAFRRVNAALFAASGKVHGDQAIAGGAGGTGKDLYVVAYVEIS